MTRTLDLNPPQPFITHNTLTTAPLGLLRPKDHLKMEMEMEIPSSSNVKLITECSDTTYTCYEVMKDLIKVSKLPQTLLSYSSSQVHKMELAECINTPSWNFPTSSYDDDDDEYSLATQEYLMTCSTAITPDSPKTDSLIMVDKHLDTIPETESDEFIKSSVENLVQNPSESEDFSEDECECDVPDCDDSQTTNFSTFSNPLFDDSTSSDDESFSDEDVPKEIYSNPLFDEEIISDKVDASIISSPKIDSLLEQFSDKLAHNDPIPPGIEEADFDLEEEIRLVENLSYDNSSPRPPEERNSENVDTIIESPSPSPIPVEDSDSHMEEIDLFLASDDSMPLGIENDDYDSEGDIRFLEEVLSNNPLPFPEIESSNLDHFNDPSSPRPPPKPPDVEICFDVEPDVTVKNDFDELNEDECFDPEGGEIDVFANVEDDDYFPFTFIIRIYLPYLTYLEVSPLLLSTGSENTIFDPDIST
ncbi:hypothetical protein Tco_1508056 [Tanacetum coccineum]